MSLIDDQLAPDLEYHTATDQRCKDSAIELEIVARLQALGLPLVPQVKVNTWVFDGAFNGTQLLLEIHGDYWHDRPEVRERDERKLAWADANGYRILTIWENQYQADGDGKIAEAVEAYHQAKALADQAEAERLQRKAQRAEAAAQLGEAAERSNYGDWRDRFLAQLAESGIVLEACLAAGVSRKTAYHYRKTSADFAEDWRLAQQDAADIALARYRRRGFEQSDRAMEYFIARNAPDESQNVAALLLRYLDTSRLTNEQIDQLAAGVDPIRVLFSTAGDPAEG